jgi:hypothetical protein
MLAVCYDRRGTLLASDVSLLVAFWRCRYENERGFAAKKLRPYEAAWLKQDSGNTAVS